MAITATCTPSTTPRHHDPSHGHPTAADILQWVGAAGAQLHPDGQLVSIDPPQPLRWRCGPTGAVSQTDPGHAVWCVRMWLPARGGPRKASILISHEGRVSDARFLSTVNHRLVSDDGAVPSIPSSVNGRGSGSNPVAAAVQELNAILRSPQSEPDRRAAEFAVRYQSHRKFKAFYQAPQQGFDSSWFAPSFLSYATSGAIPGAGGNPPPRHPCFEELIPGELFAFDLFSPEMCRMLAEEADAINAFGAANPALGLSRPNSMNHYGVVFSQVGLERSADELIQGYLLRVAAELFPGVVSQCDSSHVFTVRYREGEDLGLDMHTDDSEITFNVCLGKEFEGAGLQFCGRMGREAHRKASLRVRHRVGRCLVHRGLLRHGADDIVSGERDNLIFWLRSSEHRKSAEFHQPPYVSEGGPPDPVCLSFTHDRDYGAFKEYTPGNVHSKGAGWCPPPQFEYEGFVADAAP